MILCSLFGEIPISLQTPLTQNSNSNTKLWRIKLSASFLYLESLGRMSGFGGDISYSSCLGFLILSENARHVKMSKFNYLMIRNAPVDHQLDPTSRSEARLVFAG